MWRSRTKKDLMIEVWESLDCESVGAEEIIAIESAVRERFGAQAVESPMIIARLLADEGAELRHSEIMELFVERNVDNLYDVLTRNILKLDDLKSAAATIRDLENARRKYAAEGDKEGLRAIRETAIIGKEQAAERSMAKGIDEASRKAAVEVAEWLRIWLQSPELFESWVEVRRASAEFKKIADSET